MTIKTRKKEIITSETAYEFYCDKCGEFIGEAMACDDGWVEPIGEHFECFCIGDPGDGENYGEFKLEETLCEKCRADKMKKMVEALERLGFKKRY